MVKSALRNVLKNDKPRSPLFQFLSWWLFEVVHVAIALTTAPHGAPRFSKARWLRTHSSLACSSSTHTTVLSWDLYTDLPHNSKYVTMPTLDDALTACNLIGVAWATNRLMLGSDGVTGYPVTPQNPCINLYIMARSRAT